MVDLVVFVNETFVRRFHTNWSLLSVFIPIILTYVSKNTKIKILQDPSRDIAKSLRDLRLYDVQKITILSVT